MLLLEEPTYLEAWAGEVDVDVDGGEDFPHASRMAHKRIQDAIRMVSPWQKDGAGLTYPPFALSTALAQLRQGQPR